MPGESNPTIQRFLDQLARTANGKDHAAHMDLISKKVRVYGLPGFAALGYDDWSKQTQHEFADNILKSVQFECLRIQLEQPEQNIFLVKEIIEANDGTVHRHTAEMLIGREPDGTWRLQQERVLSEQEAGNLLGPGSLAQG